MSVDDTDIYSWPLRKYPKWMLDVTNSHARKDFAEVWPEADQSRFGRRWAQWIRFLLNTPDDTWERVSPKLRNHFRERVILSVFPAVVDDMNQPYWDTHWIEEYTEWATER